MWGPALNGGVTGDIRPEGSEVVAVWLECSESRWLICRDAFHVRVFENLDVVTLVLDGVCVGGVMVLLHNAIEESVRRENFGDSLS